MYEGLHTYGGLAGRDMEVMAIGIQESVDDLPHPCQGGSGAILGQLMSDYGIHIVKPVGVMVFCGCKTISSTFHRNNFLHGFGCRNLCRIWSEDNGKGIVSAGRKANGENYMPKLELVNKFTIPRRVYTQAHMDVIAESTALVWEKRHKIKGNEDGL